jgi:crotonobetainyl-CoA:carnitine CoA-transferase CaiB-like acyl-CoA transferase
MNECLKGIRVVDIGQFLAGPAAATWLSDFGAEVIKVERLQGDDQRRWGKPKNGQPLYWKMVSRNKKCVTLDMTKPEGIEILKKLVRTADVVVENFRPGKLAKMGIGWDVLRECNPRIVLLSVSAYGQSGPYSMRPGFGTLAEAMSGYAHITGQEDGPPTLPAFGLADSIAGLTGAFSILAALRYRDETGRGQHIDVSLLEPLMSMLGAMFVEYDQLGIIPSRLGSRLPFSAPRNIYMTKDGKALAMSSSGQRAYERTMKAIGREDLIADPRFKTNRDRGENVEALDAVIADWVGARTTEESMEILVAAGAAAMPVYDVSDIFRDPHIHHRKSITEVEDQHLGTMRMQSPPVRMSDTPPRIKFTGRDIGQDNEEVYRGLLGMSSDDFLRLKQTGVI